MTKSATKITRIAALPALVLALLVGPQAGARHSNPPPEPIRTLHGICNLSGTTAVTTYSFGNSSEETLSRGTCIGSVNGGSIGAHSVRLVTRSTLPLVDIHSRGNGWIRVEGYANRLRFRFERLVARGLLISGAAGSRASATLHRRAGDRHMLAFQAGTQLHGL